MVGAEGKGSIANDHVRLFESDYQKPVVICNVQRLKDFRANLENWQAKKSTRNSFYARTNPDDIFDLVIFDEAHHAQSGEYASVCALAPNAILVGVTATPGGRQYDKRLAPNLLYRHALHRN
jgi:superfamily II DNA or RNA helicase